MAFPSIRSSLRSAFASPPPRGVLPQTDGTHPLAIEEPQFIEESCLGGQLGQVVGDADECPFMTHLVEAAHQAASGAGVWLAKRPLWQRCNIKSAITGTYRKSGPDHAECYLASFA